MFPILPDLTPKSSCASIPMEGIEAMTETADHQAWRVAFLQVVALSLRNLQTPQANMHFLHEIDFRVQLMTKNAEAFRLPQHGSQELRKLAEALRSYVTHPDLSISDRPDSLSFH